eukprot:985097-Amphidinium_carterae.1
MSQKGKNQKLRNHRLNWKFLHLPCCFSPYFVSAGYTNICQPLDVMWPSNAALQRACVDDFAKLVLEAGASYRGNSPPACNKPKLPGWVVISACLWHGGGTCLSLGARAFADI